MTAAARLRRARGVAEVAYAHALAHESGGEGLCMVVAASMGWALRELHGIESQAVAGRFDGQPHWWVVLDGHRIDPTRHQFEDTHDLVYPADGALDAGRYVDEHVWDSLWTREQAIAEGERIFIDPGYGRLWVDELLLALEDAARAGNPCRT